MQRSLPWLTLLTGSLVMVALGSLHAFSVFLQPLEKVFETERASVALVYSLALISLTVLVLVGHRIYARFSAPVLLGVAVFMAAFGLAVAASTDSLVGVYIGYGVIFGGASGLVYGFLLQLVAQTLPHARGLAMGVVTGAYAIGAVIFAKVFSIVLASHTVSQTMLYMAGFVGVVAFVAWIALGLAGAVYTGEPKNGDDGPAPRDSAVFKMWMGYGLGSAAGLMAIGHATGIVVDVGGQGSLMVVGAMVIGLGNGIAGFIAGYLADRINLKSLLVSLPLLSAAALCVLLNVSDPFIAIAVLAVIGFAYGAIIAVYPGAVTAYFGAARAAQVYGRVFTSWGVAGLAGPWVWLCLVSSGT